MGVRDAAAGAGPGQLAGQLRRVVVAGPPVQPVLDDRAAAVQDAGRPARGAAAGVAVVETRFVFKCSALAADADIAAGEQRIGVVRAHLSGPGELTCQRRTRFVHDVGDLARQPGDIERRTIDDLDPLDVGRRDAGEQGVERIRLGGGALAIEQHVAGSLAQPAQLLAFAHLEARHLLNHVGRGLRAVPREVGGGVDLPAGGGFGGVGHFHRLRRRRIASRLILRQRGRRERGPGEQRGERCGFHAGRLPTAAAAGRLPCSDVRNRTRPARARVARRASARVRRKSFVEISFSYMDLPCLKEAMRRTSLPRRSGKVTEKCGFCIPESHTAPHRKRGFA
jgi:hypothetical protein